SFPIPVGSEPALHGSPIIEVPLVGVKFRSACERFAIDLVVEVLPATSAISDSSYPLINIAATHRDQGSMRFTCAFRNDVNDAVHGVRTPDCSARPADYFDPIDILEHRVLNFPISPCQ